MGLLVVGTSMGDRAVAGSCSGNPAPSIVLSLTPGVAAVVCSPEMTAIRTVAGRVLKLHGIRLSVVGSTL